MAEKKERLFSNFPPVSTKDWLDKVAIDLKGADFEKKLVWRTGEGFDVQPFYRWDDIKDLNLVNSLPGEYPYVRGTEKTSNNWLVREDIVVKQVNQANKKALDVLNRGADSLCFIIDSKDLSATLFPQLLEGIYPELIELNFSTTQDSVVELTKLLVSYYQEKEYDVMKLFGSIDFDYFNQMLSNGVDKGDYRALAKELIDAVAPLPFYRVCNVRADSLSNAGAYIFQELGYALAWGNAYVAALVDQGVPPANAAKKVKFQFGVGPNYFLEIAKFRAARLLWANIAAAYKPTCNHKCENEGKNGECRCASKMKIHATTSTYNLTLYDEYVNLLRTQTESMSAVLGGVDSMTILPFDVPYKESDEFSERLARNQQLLLKEEAHFDKVVDPAGGSYYIESLTKAIAEQAWSLFLSIEDSGGFYKAVKSGLVQDAITESSNKRELAVARRHETLLGTNQFPNFSELSGKKRPIEHEGSKKSDSLDVKTLTTKRVASEFEKLRLETDLSGIRPRVFMLTIGSLVMRQARAQFACNFFACAGYEVIDNLGFNTVEEGVEAAMSSKADVVVLCSSDDEYATYGEAAFKALDGRAMFVVAGAPACMDELKEKGIEHFIHVRVNALETLKEFNMNLLKR